MNGSEAQQEVFLLYNEKEEEGPEAVVAALRQRGISVYFYRTDFPVGNDIRNGEIVKLDEAQVVVVLLGRHGWGPTQRQIAAELEYNEKPLIPALIGEPDELALEDVGGLFRHRRWIDLRKATADTYDQLAQAIRQPSPNRPAQGDTPRFDEIFRTLIDGSEADRAALLERIGRHGVTDRDGLAARLRNSIRNDFSPSQENQFAFAVRDPKRLASTRSWMLSVLITLDPLTPSSASLILMHVDDRREPDRTVRFWTLAGIVRRRPPYFDRAVTLAGDDPAPEVSGLAAIATSPDDEKILHGFRSALDSDRFEIAWHVLRILRIVPIPALAGDVVAQLERSVEDKPLAYDALFALASPEMAHAARPFILDRLNLLRFVQLIVRETRESTPIARTVFARILSVFDLRQLRAALQEVAATPDDRTVVRDILGDLAEMHEGEAEGIPPIPGHAAEQIDISKDDIGIRRDVQTLASVMLARDVKPPLAIGLFGEWGTGKSFYIKSIEAAATDIAKRAAEQGQEQFCSNIVQIHFNAWHYVDTSLWASLVTHMLDGLSAHLAPRQSPAEQRAALARELASAKAEMELAKAEQELATTQLEETSRTLQDRILERERSETRLRDLRAADLLALLKDQKELDETLRAALKDVGAPAALESIAELNKVVEDSYSTAGRTLALLTSLFRGRNIGIGLAGIVLFFAAPPLIMMGIEAVLNDHAAEISALIAKTTVAAGSATLMLRLALQKAKSGLDALSSAKRKVDEQLAAKRLTPGEQEKELQKQLTEARASEKAATERAAAATARAQDLERRVAALKDSQSLGYFIAERSRSEDYRRHLGLISMIRKDFDALVERVQDTRSGRKEIDRIILYIDDVDRCPPHMVVDILQAVHLLLAYELFVVVVSVDPRWLLRSLEARMAQLQPDAPSAIEGMAATPQDYLEKIFQIPFSVRPMNREGFARLMRRVLAPSVRQPEQPETAAVAGTPAPAMAVPGKPPAGTGGMAEELLNTRSAPVSTAAPAPPEPATSSVAPVPATLDALAEVLVITAAEVEFSQKLHMLLPTPRSSKRFANIYRLLKASLSRGDLARFEGTSGVPGDFQLPMLLLALLVGRSTLAGKLFPSFLAGARAERQDWWQAAWTSQAPSVEEVRLRGLLDEIVEAAYFPRSQDLVVTWLPQVARYSFTTAKMFLDER